MINITITDLQRRTGDVTTTIVRGEQIMLTKNGKPFALITPVRGSNSEFPNNSKITKPITPKTAQPKTEEQGDYPTSYLGKPLTGRKATCPVCHEVTPVEFAQQHYVKKHADI